MNKLSKAHKESAKTFISVTSSSDAVAIAFLRHFNWNTEVAVNEFFANPKAITVPEPKAKKVDKKKIKEMFEKYKEDGCDSISGDGLLRFIADLGIEATDVMTLIISWQLGTETPCEFSRKEFTTGMERLGFDSIAAIRGGFDSMTPALDDWDRFKDFYMFCFTFNLIDGQKGMDRDIALQTWGLILKGRWCHLSDWLQFVEERHSKSVPRDTWAMLAEFIRNVGPDFKGYSETDAWPVLVDDFVEWMNEHGKGPDKGKDPA